MSGSTPSFAATPSGSRSGPGRTSGWGDSSRRSRISPHGRNRRRDRPRRHPPRLPDRRRLPDWDGRGRPQCAKIGPGSIVAAGAVVPEGKEFPPRSLIMGVPAKVAGSHDARPGADRRRRSPIPGACAALSGGAWRGIRQPVIRTPCELSLRRSSALVGGPRRLLPARSRAGSRRYARRAPVEGGARHQASR